jgi:RNA recognition motif-containing protein
MPDDAAAQKAIQELDGAMVDGRTIKVMVARPKEEKKSFNGGGNNRRSFSNNNNRW